MLIFICSIILIKLDKIFQIDSIYYVLYILNLMSITPNCPPVIYGLGRSLGEKHMLLRIASTVIVLLKERIQIIT